MNFHKHLQSRYYNRNSIRSSIKFSNIYQALCDHCFIIRNKTLNSQPLSVVCHSRHATVILSQKSYTSHVERDKTPIWKLRRWYSIKVN